ncbi:gp48 [Salisaeta icosahedral phage 1]|uniref:gp48 n=1 Tax=Salisaeta icosahedral phage 1 TaxID=1183239 RepID=UPI00025EA93D|nr:gp48 [Salisaeta icosahedral phage 1]AFJ21503.1 gp48 [Salisaeta icosahedral phage 1]
MSNALYEDYLRFRVIAELGKPEATVSRTTSAQDSARTVLNANDWRAGFVIHNSGDTMAYIRYGQEEATLEEYSHALPPGAELDYASAGLFGVPSDAITVIFDGSTGEVMSTEWSYTGNLPNLRRFLRTHDLT